MLNITFKGEPYLLTGDSLDESHAITTREDFMAGKASYAHWYPSSGTVKRYREVIGGRADIVVIGKADPIEMDLGDMFVALDNMLGGDPNWRL